MGAPLQFLRDWLPFGEKRAAGLSGEELRLWLDQLAEAPPEKVATALAATLPKLVSGETNLPMRRMLLDALQAEATRLVPTLAAAIDRSPLPLRAAARKQALAADNLLKVLAEGYQTLASELLERDPGGQAAPLLQHAILHAVKHLAHRQRLAYRAYAPASESSWRNLHRLYRIARDQGIADSGGEDERIATHYLAALLLAFADPTKFSRHDINALAAICRQLAPRLRVFDHTSGEPPTGGAHFIVRLDEARPGRSSARVDATCAADELIVDCGAAVALLQVRVAAAREAGRIAEPNDPLSVAAPLLPALLDMWRGVPGRRFSRQNFKPRVDLVSGIDTLWQFLSSQAFQRRRDDGKDNAEACLLSEWSVLDESPDGFGIRFIRGELQAIEVGEIVGLRSREHSTIHVCLVRRVTSLGAARLELGLQELSSQATTITLPNSASGEVRAIALPAMPGYRGATGLVAAPGALRPGLSVTLAASDRSESGTTDKMIVGNRRCEIWLLDSPPHD